MKNPESLLRENVRALISLVKKKNKNRRSESPVFFQSECPSVRNQDDEGKKA